MIIIARDKKIPHLKNLEDGVARVQQLIGKSANDYLGFGQSTAIANNIKYGDF